MTGMKTFCGLYFGLLALEPRLVLCIETDVRGGRHCDS